MRIGLDGAYGTVAVLDELDERPSQFMGPESDGLCDLDIFFTEEDDSERLSCGLEMRVLPLRCVCMSMRVVVVSYENAL